MFNNNREFRKTTTVTATGTVHHQVECLEEERLILYGMYCTEDETEKKWTIFPSGQNVMGVIRNEV